MAYLLDTNIAIHAIQGHKFVLDRMEEHEGELVLSALTVVELLRGVHKERSGAAERERPVQVLIQTLPIVPFDAAAALAYGDIIARRGWVRGRDYDRMIAAQALCMDSVLVTSNEADFRDVPGLSIENWTLAV